MLHHLRIKHCEIDKKTSFGNDKTYLNKRETRTSCACKMHQFSSFVLIILNIIQCGEAIVGGRHAALPPYDDPVVFVNHIGRFSRVEGYHDQFTGLYAFRGIKYAEPPIRENRFLRPRLRRLSGDIDARRNAPPCPQPDYYDEQKIIGDEDCLALNIFTPQMPDESTGLPVILWIHGGGYRYGSAAQYGAEPLIQNRIIFVPIQYRLGTLGILGDGSKEFGGNVAVFDMHAALQWIKEYIKFFGGNPNDIKVMGHGSGASGAMYLASSPMGRSSINGVVAMSGSSLSQYSYDENSTDSTSEIAKVNNCPNGNETELIKCMRDKSVNEIVLQDSKMQVNRLMGRNMIKAMNGMVSFAPTIESEDDRRGLPGIIIEKPEESLKKEPKKKFPILIGTTKHETSNGLNQNEISKIFKSSTEFLKSVAGTLKLGELLNTPKQVTNLLGSLGLPSLNDYLTIPDGADPEKVLGKLIDASTDVFFNLPSILTAELWGKWSSSYFYQFDHVSDATPSGKLLLKPLPLVSKGNSNRSSAHGDELQYLFDIYDVYGNRINGTELKTQRDQQARKNFIDLIVKFAYLNTSSSVFKLGDQVLAPFRTDDSSYIKISDKFSFEKDFRFCEMSLWGAPLKASQKITCEFLREGLKKISQAPKIRELTEIVGNRKTLFL